MYPIHQDLPFTLGWASFHIFGKEWRQCVSSFLFSVCYSWFPPFWDLSFFILFFPPGMTPAYFNSDYNLEPNPLWQDAAAYTRVCSIKEHQGSSCYCFFSFFSDVQALTYLAGNPTMDKHGLSSFADHPTVQRVYLEFPGCVVT